MSIPRQTQCLLQRDTKNVQINFIYKKTQRNRCGRCWRKRRHFFFLLLLVLCTCLCNLELNLSSKRKCAGNSAGTKAIQKSIPSHLILLFASFSNKTKKRDKNLHKILSIFSDTHDINGFPIITIETKILMDSGLTCYEVATLMLYYNTIPTK